MEYTKILEIQKNEFKNRKFKIKICLIETFESKNFKDDFIIYKVMDTGKASELFKKLTTLKNKVNNFIHKYIGVYKNE